MKTISINASQAYDVVIERSILHDCGKYLRPLLPGSKLLVATEDRVAPLYLDRVLNSLRRAGFEAESFIFPAGEPSKNTATWLQLIDRLAAFGLTRTDAVAALGGGVTGDLAGFAAACYLRGVRYVQLPTTLLAAVDSSVGGKTAVDLSVGKNLLGAFHQPCAVLCDPDTLKTLAPATLADGFGEVIKYGMYGNARLLELLGRGDFTAHAEEIIAACVAMKRDIVQRDEFDAGARQILNFGHTFAHAIEALSNFSVGHGHAVGMGMRIITAASVKKGFCPAECLEILDALLDKYGLEKHCGYAAAQLAEGAMRDKKRAGSRITLAIPTGVGTSTLHSIDTCELEDWAKAGLDA